MTRSTLRKIQINTTDYGDGRVVIELEEGTSWVVPPWEEMGLPQLEGEHGSYAAAEKALKSVDKFLADYGFEWVEKVTP